MFEDYRNLINLIGHQLKTFYKKYTDKNTELLNDYLCFGTGSAPHPTPNALTGIVSSSALNPTCETLIEAKRKKGIS
jgi:hypothetical protein